MRGVTLLLDRTAVLFLGIAAGAAIGYSFGDDRTPSAAAAPAPMSKPAALQQAAAAGSECALPFQPQLLSRVAEGGKVRVGVFGDSFGDGVYSALYQQLRPRDNFEVVKFSQQATGFTRYKRLNLEEHDSSRLSSDPVDVAVISFGANDTQGVIAKGKLAPLMTPAWQEEIGGRIDAYVRMLRRHGAIVYWVGLPRMREAAFDADIQAINSFYARRMAALGVPFIDTRPFASDAQGQYAAYLPDPATGKQTLMRANDGVHMSFNGYVWITKGLASRIRAYIDAARTTAANDAAQRQGGGSPRPS
jgi:hypothetical protein